jgi:transcriptional regulator with PAS, ATPase and Fis domain
MAAVWIVLGKTRFPGAFIESSRAHGVRDVEVPFSLSAELLPDLLRGPDAAVERFADELPPAAPEFEALVHRSLIMRRLVARARRVALRSVPVLIEGESGSGKELLARAIHRASPRAARPFVAVNCGAIPAGLLEAELFGHEKGAFTGADRVRVGHLRAADGGTLFLDELVELPPAAQVSLLRVLQEGEVVPIGASRPVRVDVRVIAASQRGLLGEVAARRFRSDLYYRLAVAVLALPPLRERQGDLDLLIDESLARINREFADDPGYSAKRLSAGARAVLHAHRWPGNVRELANTLRRAALWSAAVSISVEEARDALSLLPATEIETDVDLPALLAETARAHLLRAMRSSGGNKSEAARRLGMPSHQTLSNWLRRYEVEV